MGVSVCKDGTGLEYQVDFPNGQAAYVGEENVYVRVPGASADPVDTLICRGQETPYFHERRGAFVRSLIEQRAASAGLSALVSASIRLYRHQVEAVRKVLQDPVLRYLLADEVGLGKTIEAGVVIRQVLLDDPDARALVLVPGALVSQWRAELCGKFRLREDDGRLTVGPYSDAHRYGDASPALVVIDEAHHVAASARHPEGRALFDQFACLAHRSTGLLLLSATPALHNEQDFLAMLHLLDPATYALSDLDGFRRMVDSRQPIGQLLLAFREGVPRVRVRRMLSRVRELLSHDVAVLEFCQQLEACCAQEEYPEALADSLVRAIRVRVCETHRVYRRMVRTSRAQLADDVLCDRASDPKRVPIVEEYSTDERYAAVHDALEEWRLAAVAHILSFDENARPGMESGLAMVLQALAECSATWLPMLVAAADCRLRGDPFSERHLELLGADLLGALLGTPLFPSEDVILCAMRREAERGTDGEDQIEILVQSVRNSRHWRINRCAVMTSHTAVAKEIVRRLGAEPRSADVLTHLATDDREAAQDHLERLSTEAGPVCLVSDFTGEEGLNLQSVELLFHFDLPWDPNRLEQRIGRLDRIGRTAEVRARVLLGYEGDDSLHEAWYRVLRDGFRIFSASVADLQFFINRAMPGLRRRALYEGASGLQLAIPELQAGIEHERQLLAEQSALDEVEAFDRSQSQDFDRLITCENRELEHQAAFDSWVVDALQLRRISSPAMRFEATERTLLPRSIGAGLSSPAGHYSTFRRNSACAHQGLALLRIGDDVVGRFAEQVEGDDRGRSFVLWRHVCSWSEPDERLYFRLDFIMEADTDLARRAVTELGWPASSLHALNRRSDAWFGPAFRTLYVDQEQRQVEDPSIVSLLGHSYSAGKAAATDYNIRPSREWALDEVIAREHWGDLCRSVRTEAVACIERDPCLVQRCEESARLASEEMDRRMAQLRQGVAVRRYHETADGQSDPVAALAEEERVYRALIAGIRNPRIRIDAVGVIVLSGRNPFAQEHRYS
jgi:ATP-dependent helicase HepA